MKLSYTHISTVFLGVLVYAESKEKCDLDCGPGYKCEFRLGQCTYPPCPLFPTCQPIHQRHNSMNSFQRLENRHHHRRHHTSQLRSSLLFPELSSTRSTQSKDRPGQCPVLQGPCITTCMSDGDCTANKKCCNTGCGQTCTSPVEEITVKSGTCPRHMKKYPCTRECDTDIDCEGDRKCCFTGCGSRCTQPCFIWIEPHQANGFINRLPFICRT